MTQYVENKEIAFDVREKINTGIRNAESVKELEKAVSVFNMVRTSTSNQSDSYSINLHIDILPKLKNGVTFFVSASHTNQSATVSLNYGNTYTYPIQDQYNRSLIGMIEKNTVYMMVYYQNLFYLINSGVQIVDILTSTVTTSALSARCGKALNDLITTLREDLTTETSNRKDADTVLQNGLNAEITNRTTADTALGTRIDTVEDTITAMDEEIQSNLAITLRYIKQYANEAVDVNTLTNIGIYEFYGDANSTQWTNLPIQTPGILIVYKTGVKLVQVYYPYLARNGVFYRVYHDSVFDPWCQFYTSSKPQTSVSGNSGTTTKLLNSRTIDGVSFNGTTNIMHFGICSTAAATAAKTVTLTGFALATGAEITTKFTVTNTAANPTLNVNGTGAKPIYYRGSAISAGYLAENRTYRFSYDGTSWNLIGDIDTNTDRKVSQALSLSDKFRPILLGFQEGTNYDTSPTDQTNTAYMATGVTVQPTTGTLHANKFKVQGQATIQYNAENQAIEFVF